MSSSMPIPNRKQPALHLGAGGSSSSPISSAVASAPSSYASSIASPSSSYSSKSKQKSSESTTPPSSPAQRRPSLLGSSLSHSEHIVVNLAHADGPPRLVTCVKSSQGFDWNQDLFLPSYANYDSNSLEHRPDPVEEIILSDEEAAALLPQ